MPGLLILGDSHAAGLGSATPGAKVISRRGWSTGGYLAAEDWQAGVRQAAPAELWVSLGANDGPGSESAYRAQVQALRSQLGELAPGARIRWIGPPTVTRPALAPLVDRAALWQSRALAGMGEWVDSRPLTRLAEHAADGVHFTGKGYRAWAGGIASGSAGGAAPWLLGGAALVALLALLGGRR